MGKMGKYIYGMINSTAVPRLFIPKDLSEAEEGGTSEAYAIPYQDLSAAVSDAKVVDYNQMPRDALARLLVKHQKVVEKIMGLGYTVIPIKLGTFAQDEAEVKDIFTKGYGLMKEIMEKIAEKVETDVVAIWSDFPSVLKEVGEEKEIKEFKEKLMARPKRVTPDDQLKAGVMVKKAVDRKREECAEEIQGALKTVSQGLKEHELMDEKMIINTSFLIDKGKQRDFDKKVEEIDAQFQDKLKFKCVGPLPPYSFYTLEILKMDFGELEWARKELGLKEVVTKEDIKRAYRKKATSFHPDKHPDVRGIEKEFDEVTRAYHKVADYCRACEQAPLPTRQGGKVDRFSFKEEEFRKNAMLVRVRE